MDKVPFIYITSSSYSGSTLLAFLLNSHPQLTTISEAEGWYFSSDEDYRCSCGALVPECKFFQAQEKAFSDADLPFAYNHFGTAFSLSASERWDRLLTGPLPKVPGRETLEKLRDLVVWHLPSFAGRLRQQAKANQVFVETALQTSGARGFVDATKRPHRLRHLAKIESLDISVVHLIRDYRAFCQSVRRKWGTPLEVSLHRWLREQQAILRVTKNIEKLMVLPYQELCSNPQQAVDAVAENAAIATAPLAEDFRAVEHHILGNNMRLGNASDVRCDERWRQEMSAKEQKALEVLAMKHADSDKLRDWVRKLAD